MTRFIGIDLGTTNSTVSVANLTYRGDIEASTLRVTQIDETGNDIMQDEALPSVLYIDENQKPYVGNFAKRMHSIFTKRVIKESKPYMGTDAKWVIDDQELYPDTVASYFLGILKREVENQYQEKIDNVVITIPASFNMDQQRATQDAAILAGFAKEKIRMIPEPTAALLDYLNDERKLVAEDRRLKLHEGPQTLMVFDLGGGTCDVSILEVRENDKQGIDIQELSISQYMELGGRDFDKAVVNKLYAKYLKEINLTPQDLKEKYDKTTISILQQCLFDFAEKAKKSFSAKVMADTTVNYYKEKAKFDALEYTMSLPGHLPQELICRLSITKAEFDQAIQQHLYKELDRTKDKNIEKPILGALKESRKGELTFEDIDAVFLVGGMTYYPTIRERIYEIFNHRIEPLISINPMISVSRGAAIYNRQLDKFNYSSSDNIASTLEPQTTATITEGATHDAPDLGNHQSIIPNNVYINVAGGDPIELLPKGAILPYEKVFKDTFQVGMSVDNLQETRQMRLELFTAEKANSMQSKQLKDVVIDFTKAVKPNEKLVVKVECNKDRDVTVTAWLENDPTAMLNVKFAGREYSENEVLSTQKMHEQTNLLVTQ